jgi:hypothetical protein
MDGLPLSISVCSDCTASVDIAESSHPYGALQAMTTKFSFRWMALVAANALAVGVLGFYSTSGAAPQSGQPPFNNAVEQREATVRELREIKELLKEQNALLKAGAIKTHEAGRR